MSQSQADLSPQSDSPDAVALPHMVRGLELRTLIILRWLAVAGQTVAVLTASMVLNLGLPIGACLAVILASALTNLAAMARLQTIEGRRSAGRETTVQLGFDIVQLAVLLGLTGGLENPFCLLLVAPVTVAAAALPARKAMMLGGLALICTVALFLWSMPLPWSGGTTLSLPPLYKVGMGLAVGVGVIFTAGYAWRVAEDADRLALALAATQQVLEREQRLAALGGLAAAAAHELGTPLATIQVVAKEMLRAASRKSGDPAVAEDARLLIQQADRCREILKRLSQRPEDGDAIYAEVGLKALLEEVVQPHRGIDLDMDCHIEGVEETDAPHVRRLPEIVHGLSAIVENAADFAASRVAVVARVDARHVEVTVSDDGPGFAPDILARLGEPYVTSRPLGRSRKGKKAAGAGMGGGMGLGFFIARTLLERTGARVSAATAETGGARVTVRWPRSALEADPS
ncbi:MAG: ActS/PrrB/RegB family redox-sensitive histidine kinase [Brevundimonas sp.]